MSDTNEKIAAEENPTPTAIVTPDNKDWVKELTQIVNSLADDVKGTRDKMEAQINEYKKVMERGFPVPGINAPTAGIGETEMKEVMGHYEMAYQGKDLMDKMRHPNHTIDDKTRQELAKFYALFLRSSLFQDWKAKDLFWKHFGNQLNKATLGDPGTTFPLPDIVETEILAFAREASVILQFCRIWPMTSDKHSIPIETAGTTVAWGNTTSESTPTASEVELDANELSAYSTVRNATLMDARSDIVSWLTQCLAESAGLELDNQAFNGTGTPFIGILNTSGAGYSVTMSGTAFSDMSWIDLSNMIAKLDGLKKQGARFFMHGQILHYLRTMRDDQNRPIFFDGSIGLAVPGSVLGFPYTEVIKMPSATATSTAFLAFGNLRYFALGRRLDVSTLSANPYLGWTTNRTSYKLYQRWGMKVAQANGLVRLLTGS